MSQGSILLQFIIMISVIFIIIQLPTTYEIIRLVLIFIPLLILLNMLKMAVDN